MLQQADREQLLLDKKEELAEVEHRRKLDQHRLEMEQHVDKVSKEKQIATIKCNTERIKLLPTIVGMVGQVFKFILGLF